jgi:predicted O-methyltransferase YrrM
VSPHRPVASSPIHEELARYYAEHGLDRSQFWFGAEHPALEQAALRLLSGRTSCRVLEIGYQAGGFAVPIVIGLHRLPGFHYTGLDSRAYPNAVSRELLGGYLSGRGVPEDRMRLLTVDAWDFLMTCGEAFDLVLIDHVKGLYPRELETLLARRLVTAGGVILLHDVLEKAAEAWVQCARLCTKFHCGWRIDEGVPAGLAIVSVANGAPRFTSAMARMRLGSRFLVRRLSAGFRAK